MCGLPFSGKSTLAIKLSESTAAKIISLDEINARRGLYGGTGIPGEEWMRTHQIALQHMEELCKAGISIIIDDTNCFRWLRDAYRNVASKYNYQTIILQLNISLEEALRRAQENDQSQERNPVAVEILRDVALKFEYPDADEMVYMEIKNEPERKVIGIEVRTSNGLEQHPGTAQIGKLWQRFHTELIGKNIPNRVDAKTAVGLYTKYENDMNGMYTLIAGCEVTDLRQIPKGMIGFTIPAGKYAVFPAPGEMPQAVIEGWKRIWDYFGCSNEHQRAYTADYELYGEESGTHIYIAVR